MLSLAQSSTKVPQSSATFTSALWVSTLKHLAVWYIYKTDRDLALARSAGHEASLASLTRAELAELGFRKPLCHSSMFVANQTR
jgi:hypothetical protein